MKLRLSTRLILGVVLIEIIMLSILVWNSVRLISSSHAQRMEIQVKQDAQLLANSLAAGLATVDRAVLLDVLSLLNKDTFEYVGVYDNDGNIMAELGKTPKAKPIDLSFEEAKTDGVYDTEALISIANQTLGKVRIGKSLDAIEKLIDSTRFQNTLIAFIEIILSISVTLLLAVVVTRHLRKLEEGASALARGELNHRINIDSTDEIGDVARGFNELARHLSLTQAELKREHEELESKSQHLQALIDSVNATIVEADAHTCTVQYVSKEAQSLLGYPMNDWMEPNFLQNHIQPDDFQRLITLIEKHREGEESFSQDIRMIRDDGETVWVRDISVVVKQGEQFLCRSLLIDISKQKINEERITESELKFRTTFSSIAQAVILIDEHGIVLDTNQETEKLTGYKRDELIGNNVSKLMPEPDKSRHDSYIKKYMETGEAKIIGVGSEVTAQKKDGTSIPVYLSIGEMQLNGQRTFIGSFNDLSETKQLESQLRRSQKLDAIGQLTGGIAHDFNNILGIAIGNLELHLEELKKQDAENNQIEDIGQILDTLWRGSKLTSNLLGFSRKEAESEQIININETIEEIIDLISKSLTSTVDVQSCFDPNLWAVQLSAEDFQDAIINLSINARDAMPSGGTLQFDTSNIKVDKKINTLLSELQPGRYVLLTISDTGTGISDDVFEKIFEPFYSTKEKKKGTGLGLSMVYGFMRRSHGGIEISSVIDAGTSFKLYFPALEYEQTDSLNTQVSLEEELDDIKFQFMNMTVLIVDDEPQLTRLAEAHFQIMGFKTIITSSPTDALEILQDQKQSVDLLFSDISMPEINGIELALKALNERNELTVLLTSGFVNMDLLEPLQDNQYQIADQLMQNRLSKPYDAVKLKNKIFDIYKTRQ